MTTKDQKNKIAGYFTFSVKKTANKYTEKKYVSVKPW